MDNKWIEAFRKIQDFDRNRYYEMLPKISTRDRVSEIVWWVKNWKSSKRNIDLFTVSNIRNDRRLLVNNIISFSNWNKFLKRVLKNSWLVFEYFLVDYLQRTSLEPFPYKDTRYKFSHLKWTPEQDADEKIDFISRMTNTSKWKKTRIVFWVQLTTEKSRAWFSKKAVNWLDWIWAKRNDIRKASERIERWCGVNFPEFYVPDVMCLLSVNSSVNDFINIRKINVFKNAFSTWSNEWYEKWWPSQYLNSKIRKDFELINDGYKLSLVLFHRILESLKEKNESFKWLKEMENFSIVLEYNNVSKELKMDFFLKNKEDDRWKNKQFLMSVYFIISDKTLFLNTLRVSSFSHEVQIGSYQSLQKTLSHIEEIVLKFQFSHLNFTKLANTQVTFQEGITLDDAKNHILNQVFVSQFFAAYTL